MTVTVQISPFAKSAFGLIVKVVGPPVTTVSPTLRVPLVGQTIWNQLPVTLTASLKVIRDVGIDCHVRWRRW